MGFNLAFKVLNLKFLETFEVEKISSNTKSCENPSSGS